MPEENIEKNNRVIDYVDLMFVGAVAFFLIASVGAFSLIRGHKNNETSSATTENINEIAIQTPFEALELEARSVFVWDINNKKELYSKNADAPLPLASLTKIMTALTAYELTSESTVLTIEKEYLLQEGDTGLLSNEKWSIKNLLDLTLLSSSNDGAFAVASAIGAATALNTDTPESTPRESFIHSMDKRATALGFSSLHFNNETGLDIGIVEAGGYGSAKDIAKLLEYTLLHAPHLLEATKYDLLPITSLNEITHYVKNTNALVAHVPGLIASKTGYSELAGGNLVVAFDAGLGRPIIISVLGSSYEGRFVDMEKLISATMKTLR